MFSGPSADVLSVLFFDCEGDTYCAESSFQNHNMKATHSSHTGQSINSQAFAAACIAVQAALYVDISSTVDSDASFCSCMSSVDQ